MQEYIQWFVEKVIQKEYRDEEKLSLWILQKGNYQDVIDVNKIPHCFKEQMTIYDMAV